MADFMLLTDSSCDLPGSLAAEKGIEYVPLTVRIDGREYRNELDWREISPHEFYQKLRAGARVQTSAPTAEEFQARMTAACEAGKDVLYLGFSSALSSAFQTGHQAMEAVSERFPERKLLAVDTLSASLGQGLLVMLAQQRKEAGCTIEQTAEFVEKNRLRLCHWFTMPDLEHLRRGGRISASSAVLGTMLNIRPVLHMNNRGELEYVAKARGARSVYQRFMQRVRETAQDPAQQMMFISHGDDEEEALFTCATGAAGVRDRAGRAGDRRAFRAGHHRAVFCGGGEIKKENPIPRRTVCNIAARFSHTGPEPA